MFLGDEPLLHAIVIASQDPDPVRAARYRPFASGISRRLSPKVRPSHATAAEAVSGGRGFAPLAIARRLAFPWGSPSTPCCPPACC